MYKGALSTTFTKYCQTRCTRTNIQGILTEHNLNIFDNTSPFKAPQFTPVKEYGSYYSLKQEQGVFYTDTHTCSKTF